MLLKVHTFFKSSTLISNTSLNLTKTQTKAKNHPEAEHLLNKNYPLSLSILSSKTDI